jgi:hypothetical protein
MASMGHLNPYLPYLATLLHTGRYGGLVSHIFTVYKNRKHLKTWCIIIYIMTVSDWAGLILTALSIVAITVGGIRWFVQSEIKILSADLKNDLSELKPNHGSSMKDQVNRLEEKSHKLEEKIDTLVNILITEGVKTQKKIKSEKTEL